MRFVRNREQKVERVALVTDSPVARLAEALVITYHRGWITVLDPPRLERLSCERYGVVKKETDRLLPVQLPRELA